MASEFEMLMMTKDGGKMVAIAHILFSLNVA